MANAFNDSSDDVVTLLIGTSYFWIDVSDSPSLPRIFETAPPSAARTCSLLAACACSCASESPDWQLMAFRVSTYWLPRLAIEPDNIALLPTRWHNSRAR